MSAIRPSYYVIDSTPKPGENRVDRTNTYPTLAIANTYLSLHGPPLPVIIQIQPGQEEDLKELTDLVKSVPNGDSNIDAQMFVKAVIAKIEHLEIWPDHTSPYYVLVNSARASKYISQEWKYMSDVTSGTTNKTPGFPSFVHAFVWALAGGNAKLSTWGLSNRWCWTSSLKNAPSTPTRGPSSSSTNTANITHAPSTPTPPPSSQQVTGTSQAPTPAPSVGPHVRWETSPSPVSLLARSSSPALNRRDVPMPNSDPETSSVSEHGTSAICSGSKKKGKSRLRPAPSVLPVRGRVSRPTASCSSDIGVNPAPLQGPESPKNFTATTSRDPFAKPTAPRFCSPAMLMPPSILKNPRFTSNNLPIISYKTPNLPGVGEVAWSEDFPASEEALLLPAITNLPPFVEFAARVLGWDEGMLKVVQVAWSCDGNRDSFILTLGDAGMPLAEAYLLWRLLSHRV